MKIVMMIAKERFVLTTGVCFGLLNGREDGHNDDLWQTVETVMMMVYVNCRNSHGDGLW